MLQVFLEWQSGTQTASYKITYNDLLEFIAYLKEENKSIDRINKHLLVIRHHFDRQVISEKRATNPAVGLQIRKQQKSYPKYLPITTLEKLLKEYQGKHKLLLSLIIHQGLSLGNLEQLQVSHLELEKGELYVPKSAKLKSRILKLEASQVVPLMELRRKKKSYLFGPKSLKNLSYQLCKKLQQISPEVKSLQQLRGSIITYWLKTEDLRTVQYKAGHGSINATEKYLTQDLQSLAKSIENYHPLQ